MLNQLACRPYRDKKRDNRELIKQLEKEACELSKQARAPASNPMHT
jgi:hypothetical protein